ncbi:hypothetical protein chiPu_0002251 [Chiloscyllium punctatum]|uniref:Uncharacterized protein n=1 Tax=Chiloscyllium punctatum TaxID=137246 RepID=A0A401S0C9_CHIPU|nr:hypothetical protein [Chiloscyllium punctatum]
MFCHECHMKRQAVIVVIRITLELVAKTLVSVFAIVIHVGLCNRLRKKTIETKRVIAASQPWTDMLTIPQLTGWNLLPPF